MRMPSQPIWPRWSGVAWIVIVPRRRAAIVDRHRLAGVLGDRRRAAATKNVIGWPSTATTTSPALMPARSAGSPAFTDLMCGWTSGSTPMSPISKRPNVARRA